MPDVDRKSAGEQAPQGLRLGVGFSSCPNDTFMFHALVHGLVPCDGIGFRSVIEDIEALNERALAGADALPITKLSASVLGHLTDRYTVLSSGAALGRGCGPLVVVRDGASRPSLAELNGLRVAVPGLHTTAHLLLRMFAPDTVESVPMRFDDIMSAVADGTVDAGVVIHEGRFTYGDAGLALVADLGECWESSTDLPLPLGLICAARSLEDDVVHTVAQALAQSIVYGRRHPQASRSYVARMAQELAPDVCARHIALYVNEFSVALDDVGRRAVDELLRRAKALGALPSSSPSPWRS